MEGTSNQDSARSHRTHRRLREAANFSIFLIFLTLGHIVGHGQIKTNKVKAISEFSVCRNVILLIHKRYSYVIFNLV